MIVDFRTETSLHLDQHYNAKEKFLSRHCSGTTSPTSEITRKTSHLDDVQDLSRSLLHLPHLVHQVPELGCTRDLVGREHLHAVHGRVWLLLRRGLAAYHLVLAHPNHLCDVDRNRNSQRRSKAQHRRRAAQSVTQGLRPVMLRTACARDILLPDDLKTGEPLQAMKLVDCVEKSVLITTDST